MSDSRDKALAQAVEHIIESVGDYTISAMYTLDTCKRGDDVYVHYRPHTIYDNLTYQARLTSIYNEVRVQEIVDNPPISRGIVLQVNMGGVVVAWKNRRESVVRPASPLMNDGHVPKMDSVISRSPIILMLSPEHEKRILAALGYRGDATD